MRLVYVFIAGLLFTVFMRFLLGDFEPNRLEVGILFVASIIALINEAKEAK